MAIRWPKTNNPLYPLPPDYHSLSVDGQRLARKNAVSLQVTPDDLVYAWSFFRSYYLNHPGAHWYKKFHPSPPLHYTLVRDIGTYSANAEAAPRSSAKSTVANEVLMLELLTRKNYTLSSIRATDRKSRKNLRLIKRQLDNNSRLNDDFGDGNPLRPKKGDRIWNTEMLEMPWFSTLEGISINGALRGDRPDLIVVDDPEYDEDDNVDTSALIGDFETLLFNVLLGMLDDGAALWWIGTFISRRSFLYHICKSDDVRFDSWNRRFFAAEYSDGTLLWPEKWSKQALEDKKARMGLSAYRKEMLNQPGTGADRILQLHPHLCVYRVDGAPERERDPLASTAILRFEEGFKQGDETKFVEERREFGPWASGLYKLLTVDYARGFTDTSDYSCVATMGFDKDDTLWLLDLFLGRVREDALVQTIWDHAMKWRVKMVGVEAVSIQKHLADRVASMMSAMSAGTGYVPRVIPITYARRRVKADIPSQISKADRIAGLEWRFNQFRIRYPVHRQREFGIKHLIQQTEDFTMDLALLTHDDAIDTVAMHQYMVRRQGLQTKRPPRILTPFERVRKGELIDPVTHIPHLSGFNADEIPFDVIQALRQKRMDRRGIPKGEQEITWNQLHRMARTSQPFTIWP